MFEKLNCSEVDLFDACIAWAKSSCHKNGLDENNSKDLKDQLGSCFHLIQFNGMSGEEICKIFANQVYKNLFNQDELIEIMQMKHMKKFQSKIFKSKLRLKWSKDSNQLTCRRSIETLRFTESVKIDLSARNESQESTWFSINQPLTLKQIQFDVKLVEKLSNGVNDFVLWNSTVEIVEYNTNTFARSKILHTNTCNVGRGKNVKNILTLNVPVIPQRIYEVRLVTDPYAYRYYYHTSWWTTDVQLNDQIAVKFHQNPSDPYCYRRGLVSCLVFNRIYL